MTNTTASRNEMPATREAATSDRRHLLGAVGSVFTSHPAKVNETYWQHAAVAFGFSVQLFRAALAALVHAILPFACESTASEAIEKLHQRMKKRHTA